MSDDAYCELHQLVITITKKKDTIMKVTSPHERLSATISFSLVEVHSSLKFPTLISTSINKAMVR
nr:unnamed protein product [Callosobruchus analis]